MKYTRVTLYTVDHAVIGSDHKGRRYFRTYEEAAEFAKGDYTDKVVCRTYSKAKAEAIMEIEDFYNSGRII